jgi:hypothetical protein
MTAAHPTLEGGCHCGAITLAFSTALTPETTSPRACDCSFCRAHGAAWISDPAGQLVIRAQADRLRRYRQASLAAQFLLCGECGVLVGVLFQEGAHRYAAVNAVCLAAREAFAPSVSSSPQMLAPDDKAFRWRQLWVRDVRGLD